jgi:hypothetical protein
MNSHKTLPLATMLGTLVLVLLLALAATGCGTSAGATAPTPSSPSTTATAQKCGTISVAPRGVAINLPGATKADVAGNCFWQNFQECRVASLIVSFGGVDTITTHTFTVQKKNTGCAISDVVQHRVVPRPAQNVGTFTCSGLVNIASELHFRGCGTSGDIVVPMK